jgi:hypothetical protein
VFGLLFAVIFIKQKYEVFSTVPNVLRIQNAQNISLESFLTPFYKRKNGFAYRVGESDLSERQLSLVNFVPLTVTQPGFIGPAINGVFDEKNGVSKLVRTGIRSFVLMIDYHEEFDMKPPLYAEMKTPCLLIRDKSGSVRSLNSGSISKICQTLADGAFGPAAPFANDPLLLTLYFVRTPDPLTDQKGFLRFCSQVAKELAPLTQYHLGQTPLGSYNRQGRQNEILFDPLTQFEKKVLIFSNLDTSLFRTVKPSYQPKEDLDYWIHLRLVKDSTNSLGVTQPVSQNQRVMGIVDTTQYFTTIPPENVAAKVKDTMIRWNIGISDVGTNPATDKLTIMKNTIGVQSVPISIVEMNDAERELLNVWKDSAWAIKAPALRFTKPEDTVPKQPSPQLNANQGRITSPSL